MIIFTYYFLLFTFLQILFPNGIVNIWNIIDEKLFQIISYDIEAIKFFSWYGEK
jgi:hypothetical protein